MTDSNIKRLSDVIIVVLSSIGCYLDPLFNPEGGRGDRYLTNLPKQQPGGMATIHGVPVWNEFGGDRKQPLPLHIIRYAFVLFGNERWYYVISNVIINSCASAFFYIFCCNLLGQSAAFHASLIFYLHPLHSEVVCDVVGLPHLVGCLALMTWCYMRCDVITKEAEAEAGDNRKWKYGMRFLLLLPVLCLCSFISLEVGFTLLLLQLAIPKSWDPNLRPYTVINIVFMSVIFRSHVGAREECPVRCDVITAIRCLSNALLHLAYPSNAPYQHVTAEGGSWVFPLFCVFFLASLKWSKALVIGLLLLLTPISVSLATTCTCSVTSLYLSSAGLSILIALSIAAATEKDEKLGKMAKFALLLFLFFFAALKLRRNFEWRSRDSAIRSSFARNPNSSELLYEIGKLELRTGSGELKAFRYFVSSFRSDPGNNNNGHFLLSAAWILENFVQTRRDQEKVLRYLTAASDACRNNSDVINRKSVAFTMATGRVPDATRLSHLVTSAAADAVTSLTSLLRTVTSSELVDDATTARLIAVGVRKLCGCSESDDVIIDWSRCGGEVAPLADMYAKVKDTERDTIRRWFSANRLPDCDVIMSSGDGTDDDVSYAQIVTCVRQDRFTTERALRLVNRKLANQHPAKAGELLEEILKMRPHDAEVQFEKAALLRDRGRWKDAAEICRQLIQADLKCANLHKSWRLLARFHDRNGQTSQSLNLYRMCLKRLNRRLKSRLLADDVMEAVRRDAASVRVEMASRLRMVSHGRHRNGEKQASLVAWKENIIHLRKAMELNPGSTEVTESYERFKDVDHTKLF